MGGSAGSIAFKKGKDFLDKNPKYKEAIKKELADTLAKGWKNASAKYPLLDLIAKPQYIMQNEKARVAQAGHLIKEVQKQEIYTQREATKELLSKIVGEDIRNANDGRVAQVSKKNIAKMLSDKAIAKSVNNGFSELEHIEAVKNIRELYIKSEYLESSKDKSGAENLIIHRYRASMGNDVNALITLKETTSNKYKGTKIYTLQLQRLENVAKL